MGLHRRLPAFDPACPRRYARGPRLPDQRGGSARGSLSTAQASDSAARPAIARVYRSLDFTAEFLETLSKFSKQDQRRIVKALGLLDDDERHPSLRVHELAGHPSRARAPS